MAGGELAIPLMLAVPLALNVPSEACEKAWLYGCLHGLRAVMGDSSLIQRPVEKMFHVKHMFAIHVLRDSPPPDVVCVSREQVRKSARDGGPALCAPFG